jgi:phosphocarrier protein
MKIQRSVFPVVGRIEQGCDLSESISVAQNFHVAHRQVGVTNVHGLHLRGAGKFVKLANTFQSDVRVCCKGIRANGRSILSLVCLAAECGTMLALEAQGCDAEDAVVALANLILARSPESEDQGGEPA